MENYDIKLLSNLIFKPATILVPAQYARFIYQRNIKHHYYLQDGPIKKHNIDVHSIYGYSLKATWYQHKQPSKQLIFLVPGYATVELEMECIAPFFFELGYDVVTYNTYAYGNSNALVSFGKRESQDFLKLYETVLAQQHYDCIGLYGHSLGANTVLHAGSMTRRIPDFIIANAPFNRLDETIASHFSLWAGKLKLQKDPILLARQVIKKAEDIWGEQQFPKEAMTAVAKLTMPVLYLHGTADDMNPFYMSDELLKVTKTATKVALTDANHLDTFITTKKETETAIIDFLNTVPVANDIKKEAK